MSRRISNSIAVLIAILAFSPVLRADGGTYGSYTPYSIFGIGDLLQPGTAYNRSMGGVGIAGRNNRYINILNPAAVTARDSLAFMTDFSVYSDNKLFSQKGKSGNIPSASNTFNLNDCVISFPIWRSSAMMVGLTPVSGTGYGYVQYENKPEIIGNVGNITYTNNGVGGIYQLFIAGGVTFFKKLSLGAEYIYYFGDIEKTFQQSFSDESNVGSNVVNSLQTKASAAKFGIQFEQKVGSNGTLCIGGTYRLGAALKGELNTISGMDTTTVAFGNLQGSDRICIAGEKGIGISYRQGTKFCAEFDYTRSDWKGSNIDRTSNVSGFSPTVFSNYRAGVEYTPNRNDIRYYYKKISYRAGAYYRNEYYSVNGREIKSMGITLGATLPIARGYSGVTVGLDLGQRGTMKDGLIRERYANFTVGVNLFDIWFMKHQYD